MEKVSPSSSITAHNSHVLDPRSSKEASVFWIHTKVLVWKQYLVFTRSMRSTLFQIFTPVFICIFLVILQQFADYAFSNDFITDPDMHNLDYIPRCYGNECITVGIGYTHDNTTDLSQFVIDYLSENYDLEKGRDIQVLASNYNDLINYLSINTNKTQTVVLFCTGEFELPNNSYYNGTFNCMRETPGTNLALYSIMINSTITPLMFLSGFNVPRPVDYASLSVKLAVDTAIMAYYNKLPYGPSLSIEVGGFPTPPNRYLDGYSIVTNVGVFYFFIPPMVTFVVMLIEIVREKEYKLRHGLTMIGMNSGPYWLSWVITGFVFTFIVTNSLIVSCLACLFDVFLNTPYPFMLLLFTVFSLSMISLAFLLSTLLTTTKSAYTTSYAFILIGLVLQFLLSDVTLIYLMYGDDVETWVKVVRTLLTLYPPFNFSKAFGDISLVSGQHYDNTQSRWLSGDTYTWHDFTRTIYSTVAGSTVTVPSTALSVLTIIGNAFMIGVIAWYLDHVIASNRGTPDPWYFVISPFYWCKRSKRLYENEFRDNAPFNDNLKVPEPSICSDSDIIEGISIRNICKTFYHTSCCVTLKELKAVNDFSLEVGNKELLAVLGHNGAGKSTLINILTGLTTPTSGNATVCGYDLRTQLSEIRKILGVCPQHDILWGELTPLEHLTLFSRIKCLPYATIEKESEEKLKQVKLFNVKNNLVSTFSGGMKRRLSVAISGVGNPKLMILDEPTTGMDPINRRNAWKLIQKMKEGRTMILTTHSMEEADVLSDRVCVIVDGELKCLGTSLNLKNNFGDGYRITIITKEPKELSDIMVQEFPAVKVIDISAGSIVISIPLDRIEQIELFFRTIEGMEKRGALARTQELIEDWGLSNTTLEEVFMRVTGKKARVEGGN